MKTKTFRLLIKTILLFAGFNPTCINAQEYYTQYWTTNPIENFTLLNDLSGCTSQVISTCPTNDNQHYIDMAVTSNYIYWTDGTKLYRRLLTDPNSCEFLGSGNMSTGIVADNQGNIYSGGAVTLVKYDAQLNSFITLGNMPPGVNCAGDAFRRRWYSTNN